MTISPPERAPVLGRPDDATQYIEDLTRYQFAASFVRDKRALDLGFGTGYGTALLVTDGKAAEAIGYDRSPVALTHALTHFASPRVRFGLSIDDRLPIDDQSVDVAVCLETFEHVPDPGRLLAEIARVIAPGGLAILSTPLNESEGRFRPENPHHVREYSAHEFRGYLGAYFPFVEMWSQVTTYADDVPFVVRAMLPPALRQRYRLRIRSKGRRPVASRIVRGIHPGANVQIGVVRVLSETH